MAYLKAYTITLVVDGAERVFNLDNTLPTIDDWATAVKTAILLVKMSDHSAGVDLLSCKEYVPLGLDNIEYFYPLPLVIQ